MEQHTVLALVIVAWGAVTVTLVSIIRTAGQVRISRREARKRELIRRVTWDAGIPERRIEA